MTTYVCNINNCNKKFKTLRGYNKHKETHNIDEFEDEQLKLGIEISLKDLYKDYIQEESESLNLKKCSICLEKLISMVIINCGHCVLCNDCGNKLLNLDEKDKKCPICRKNISNIINIYF
jgi:hypothetical protein